MHRYGMTGQTWEEMPSWRDPRWESGPGVSSQIGFGMESENYNILLRFCQIQTTCTNVFMNY